MINYFITYKVNFNTNAKLMMSQFLKLGDSRKQNRE